MINSFSVLATKECMKELSVLCFSIRQHYDIPIFIVCDKATKEYITLDKFTNIYFRVSVDDKKLRNSKSKVEDVKKSNTFHSAEKILLKMDCVEWAAQAAGNTLFVDADIVISKPIHEDVIDSYEVMVSPHFHPDNHHQQTKKYGAFNAGYLYTSNTLLAEVWRDIYLNRSTFYEQQGMIHFFEYFHVGTFDVTHNYGYWRFSKEWINQNIQLRDSSGMLEKAKSYHFHTDPKTFQHADTGLRKGYSALYNKILPNLNHDLVGHIRKNRCN